ncbi:MAG: DUF4271 domain-containing protein, partial [Bacteroidales bacterium]
YLLYMLNTSSIKPIFNYDSLLTEAKGLFENSFTQKILQKNSQKYTEYYISAKKLLPYYNYSERFITLYNHDWVIILGIILLVFLTYVKVQFPQVIRKLINSIVNFQYARQLVDEKSGIVQKSSWFLLSLFVISFSLFLTAFIYYINPASIRNPYLFLVVLSFVLGFYILKISLYLFIAYLTDTLAQTKLILLHYSVYYRNFSLFLTPVSIVLYFIHFRLFAVFFALIALLFVVFSIMRIYRAIFLSLQMRFSYLFIFLYLCTIEIMPLLYSYKMLIMWV